MISERTKAALKAAKARGVKLGSPAPWKGSAIGAAATRARADIFARNILPIIREVHGAGVTSLTGVARALNARGVKTARGRAWEATTGCSVLRRAATAAPFMDGRNPEPPAAAIGTSKTS